MDTLLIRADASVAIGTGHVMRCLALAQAWQDSGGRAVFAMAETTPAVSEKLISNDFAVRTIPSQPGSQSDAGVLVDMAVECRAEWVVVDGYRFDAAYQWTLKERNLKLLVVDDNGHAREYAADLVLNQNLHAAESLYARREAYTRLLLGTGYSLLRREFRAWRTWKRRIPSLANRLLIIMGGSDFGNSTDLVIDALQAVGDDGLEAVVVVGGSNPHSAALERKIAELKTPARLCRDVAEMPELMSWADVAISAAGSTCWEMCLLGLPALLIDVAENQAMVAQSLHEAGCAIHVDSARNVSSTQIACELVRLMNSHDLRESLSRRCRELVDGCGAERVSGILNGRARLRLRRAQSGDMQLFWEWANDTDVRSASFSPAPIAWETHVSWFELALSRNSSLLLVAEDEMGKPLGQVRFDARSDGDYEVDVSIARPERGRGLAATLIQSAVQTLLAERRAARVHAMVKCANAASARAFERAGFHRAGLQRVQGAEAIHFTYEGQ
jgi:UDP-2,4-diacetamido-2,4,6-trideoxy-beta-L-altropyranose hydrolase